MRINQRKAEKQKGIERLKRTRLMEFFVKYKWLHLMAIPGILYFLIFKYLPMGGLVIAFKNYKGVGGIAGIFTAEWVGFAQFERFFSSIYFTRLMRNTLLISVYRLVFSFPCPILLAVLINEITSTKFKRTVQTISYMPHFLSWVVVAGLLATLLSTSGPINEALAALGLEKIYFLSDTRYFRSVLVVSEIWKGIGWGSIVYLAAITGIDPQIYEAASIDGANRWQRILHITIPSIKETIAIMLILQVGKILNENFEQIFNLYNPSVYEVADVFETYVYRIGLVNQQYSYSAAVGLFKSVISLILVVTTNRAAKRMGNEGLW